MLVTLLMLAVFFACIATLYTEGLWGNAIRLINVVTAALLAMNFFEPLARKLNEWQPSYEYFWDFLSLWAIFVFFVGIFQALTKLVSRVKVRFLKIVDRIGSGVLAVWIGWVMVCFTLTTLHTAPLARNFLNGDFQPEERMVMGFAPDRQWLSFTQWASRGPYAADQIFDPHAEFMPKYNTRRRNLQKHVHETNSFRVR